MAIFPSIKDDAGKIIKAGISEKIYMDVGGIRQGMFLRGMDTSKPVLLFLHGGPGSPELAMGMNTEGERKLAKFFVVCYWDQRGAGMSFSSKINQETMTVSQMIEDTKEVTLYLQKRFNKDKIYIMGHSWGTYLGIKTISKYPELYYAYMGMGQVTNQKKSEILAYHYMLEEAKRRKEAKAIQRLQAFDVNDASFPPMKYIQGIRSKLMNEYGIGVMHENASMSKMLKDMIKFKGYTLKEKMNYMRGLLFSQKLLFPNIIEDSLFVSSKSFNIPVFILHGKYDYQVSHDLAKEYYESIDAPRKGFYTFEHSAHSPFWEEPEAFAVALREIVKYSEEAKR